VPVAELIRKVGISEQTFYRWKAKYSARPRKQQNWQSQAGSNGVEQRRLVAVEVASAVATVSAAEYPGALAVLLSNDRRVEVGRGFDAATLAQLVTVLERL
jgi:hypothetical protein